MRYPEFLKTGDTIGFPAPSFGCNIEPYRTAFDHAQEVLREKGFQTICGPNAYAGDGIGISSSPENCGREVTEMLLSDTTDALISCGGGEMMCEILNYVDFDRITQAKPKWFMGYSDNTNLTFLLTTLCDTAAIYGPCAASFGMEPWHEAIQDAYRLLRGEKLESKGYSRYETNPDKDADHPLEPYACTAPREIRAFDPERGLLPKGEGGELAFSGRLIGGNLNTMEGFFGTPYMPSIENGDILLIEDTLKDAMTIERSFSLLKLAGVFDRVGGIILGKHEKFDDNGTGRKPYEILSEVLGDRDIPILADFDCCHTHPMLTLPIGCRICLNADEKTVSLLERPVL